MSSSDSLPFVTVQLCLDTFGHGACDNRRQFCLRVPVTPATTVRQLAKEAMKRLVVLARHRPLVAHRDGEHILRLAQHVKPQFSASEVIVVPRHALSLGAAQPTTTTGTTSTAGMSVSPVELFSCDLVTSVVALATEAVRLRLRVAETDTTTTVSEAFPPHSTALEHQESSVSTVELDALPPRRPPTMQEPLGLPVPTQTHEKLGQERKRRRVVTIESGSESAESSNATTSDDDEEVDERQAAHRRELEAESIALLRERETARRLRGGHDADKHFASNYLSSPQKLMNRRYTRRRNGTATQPTTATTSASTEETTTHAVDDSPPPLTAPSSGATFTASHMKRHRSPCSLSDANLLRSPPAIPPELLPDARTKSTSPVAARQLRFDDDEEHLTSPAQVQHDATRRAPLPPSWSPAKDPTNNSHNRSPVMTNATMTPPHFLSSAFSQPLPAAFKLGTPSKPEAVAAPGASDVSPAPQTPPTVPRAVVASHGSVPNTPQKGESPKERLRWGESASKYFDASTYCDNPNKAHIDDSQRHQPIRARRNKEPSPMLRHIL